MNKIKTIAKWSIPALTVLVPLAAVLAITPPAVPITGQAVTLDEIENLINGIARFLIVVSTVVAVIFIVYGGVRWVTAHGNEEAAGNAKKIILNGIYGALVILGVGVILRSLAGVVSRSFFGGFGQ